MTPRFRERPARRVRHVPAMLACRRRNRPDDGAADRPSSMRRSNSAMLFVSGTGGLQVNRRTASR
ncbi:MAG: hypothetical protein OXC57_07310 [Rhodobacteraceae bacterium]|nr:hypothetical protein [Paracoccaceae bacterium]